MAIQSVAWALPSIISKPTGVCIQLLRTMRRGRTFYGCANYPECEFTSWKRPIATPCPACGGLLVEHNRTKVQCISCERVFPREDFPEAFPEAAAETETD